MPIKPPKVDSKQHEQEILGISLISDGDAERVSKIPSSLFYYSRHREIHKVICLLVEQKQKIDMLALIAKLGDEYQVAVAEIGQYGLNPGSLHQRVNELRDIRFKHTVANLPPDTSIEELEDLIDKYKPEQEEDRSYIPDRDELLEKVIKYRYTGSLDSMSCGYDGLEDIYRVAKGQLVVWTGIPGHGKSTFIDNIAVRMADKFSWKTCYFSPESYPIEQHYARLIEIHTKLSMANKTTTVQKISEKKLEESFNFVYEHIKSLYIPPDERTLDGIMSQVTSEYDSFVLDPWNEIEHKRDAALSETEYIGKTLMRLKAYAVFKDIHVDLIAHPKKLQKDENGKYNEPEPYDISGSANWYNKPDICVTIHKSGNGEGEFHVKKVRVRGTGRLTHKEPVLFTFNWENQTFEEKEKNEKKSELPI